MKPQFLAYDEIDALHQAHPELIVDDHIDLAFEELYDIKYPSKKDTKSIKDVNDFKESVAPHGSNKWGTWVYYSWLNRLVHMPSKKELRALRTSRNRNLITADEQVVLYDSSILIIGMSVGSNVVEALVAQGIGSKLILVDMDNLEPSNLNRVRSPYYHVGLHKVDAISRKVWEIDPYIEVFAYKEGLNEQNLNEIIELHSPNVIVDEMDELRMKIILREKAKKVKLPVIMAADDGDDALLDIERYDIDNQLEIFSGSIPQNIINQIKNEKLSRPQLGLMIGKYFVGSKNIPLRMYESLGEVGKTLPSWPQLGSAAALSGVSLSYVVKKILLGHRIKTGRILISLDDKLDLERLEDSNQEKLKKFQEMLER
ncbi:MAG TPA: ThiF family adenylyltransferase [Candidatus Binatia bacterium]|nr:ThiF family adenylyltransferase [Candidatus Binatia bacterium]